MPTTRRVEGETARGRRSDANEEAEDLGWKGLEDASRSSSSSLGLLRVSYMSRSNGVEWRRGGDGECGRSWSCCSCRRRTDSEGDDGVNDSTHNIDGMAKAKSADNIVNNAGSLGVVLDAINNCQLLRLQYYTNIDRYDHMDGAIGTTPVQASKIN